MKRLIGFDYRSSWQDGSPSEHGSPAELCFKARHGLETVICRVPSSAILNALQGRASDGDGSQGAEDHEGRRVCEALYDANRPMFQAVARTKIAAGAFAMPIGHVKSILISEDELVRKMRETNLLH
jgi:hypothetical protein